MTTTAKAKPDFRAYVVVERENQKSFWLDIGAAFLHNDGAGMNLVLHAVPVGGKVVLRDFREGERREELQA